MRWEYIIWALIDKRVCVKWGGGHLSRKPEGPMQAFVKGEAGEADRHGVGASGASHQGTPKAGRA